MNILWALLVSLGFMLACLGCVALVAGRARVAFWLAVAATVSSLASLMFVNAGG